jgi:hypothetical protein
MDTFSDMSIAHGYNQDRTLDAALKSDFEKRFTMQTCQGDAYGGISSAALVLLMLISGADRRDRPSGLLGPMHAMETMTYMCSS